MKKALEKQGVSQLLKKLPALYVIWLGFSTIKITAFFFFFRACQLMPWMHLSLRLIVQP